MSLLVPASWNWQRDAAGFYEQNHYVFLALAVSYYPVVFGLRYFMKNKTELDLGKGHITSYIATHLTHCTRAHLGRILTPLPTPTPHTTHSKPPPCSLC